jgi:hypothetical protein
MHLDGSNRRLRMASTPHSARHVLGMLLGAMLLAVPAGAQVLPPPNTMTFDFVAHLPALAHGRLVFISECNDAATVFLETTAFDPGGGLPFEEPFSTEVLVTPGGSAIVDLPSYPFPVFLRLREGVTPGACAPPGMARIQRLFSLTDAPTGRALAAVRPDFKVGPGQLVNEADSMTTLFYRGSGEGVYLAMHKSCPEQVHVLVHADEIGGEARDPQMLLWDAGLMVLDIGNRVNEGKYGRVSVQFHWDREGSKASTVPTACLSHNLAASLMTVGDGTAASETPRREWIDVLSWSWGVSNSADPRSRD